MKPVPNNPYAFQARVMKALIGDIRDTGSPTFARLDALREVARHGDCRSGTVAGPASPGARSGLRHTGTIDYRKEAERD